MSVEVLLALALTLAVTFVVLLISFGLVVHKATEERKAHRRAVLYERYSGTVVDLLMRELPPLPAGSPRSAIFRQYEALFSDLRTKLQRLGAASRNAHREAVRHVIMDVAKDVSGETADRVVHISYLLGFVDETIALLRDRRWWIRAQAAHDLGVMRARRAIVGLTAALEDLVEDVRSQAMKSLVILAGVEALRTILRLSKELSAWASVELSVIVLQFKHQAVPYLIEGLLSGDQSVVLFCIEMMSEIGFVSAVEPLMKIARENPNVHIRLKAVEALGRLGDQRSEQYLLTLTNNPLPPLRLKALEALGRIGSQPAIPLLMERLQRGDAKEKVVAARAAAMAGPAGIDELHRAAAGKDSLTVYAVGQVLEEVEAEGAGR